MEKVTEDGLTSYLGGGTGWLDADEQRSAAGMIAGALSELAQPDHFATQTSNGAPHAFLLYPKTLVDIELARSGSDAVLRVRSHPLVEAGVVIELERGRRIRTEAGGMGYGSEWTFRFSDGNAVTIAGEVQTQPEPFLSGNEQFAREVAGRTGDFAGLA